MPCTHALLAKWIPPNGKFIVSMKILLLREIVVLELLIENVVGFYWYDLFTDGTSICQPVKVLHIVKVPSI